MLVDGDGGGFPSVTVTVTPILEGPVQQQRGVDKLEIDIGRLEVVEKVEQR